MIDPFRNYQSLFVVIMPDLQDFYQSPLNKRFWRSFVQILRAITIATVGLLTKERLAALYIGRHVGHGGNSGSQFCLL